VTEAQAHPSSGWRFADLGRAAALCLDPEKLLTGAAGLFLASLAFGVVYWLGLKTLEPGAVRVFTIVGVILASCIWVLFSGIIAKMSLTQLLEGRKAGAAEIRRFLAERWPTLIGTPLAFGSLSLLMLGFLALMELLGSLPGLGPILFSASFLLAFSLAFMATLTALVHGLSVFIYPSVVALRGAGAMGVLIEMFDLVRRRGLQLLLCEAVVGVAGSVMTAVIGSVVWAGLYIVMRTALAVMEERFELALSAVPEFFRIFLRPFESWLPYVPEPLEVVWHYDLSGFLLGASLLCVIVGTAVYPFVFFNTAGSITYLILRSGGPEGRSGG
jgi:hypothetical protein